MEKGKVKSWYSWYNAIFVNWFGLKLMIPFALYFFNFHLGLVGMFLWAGCYLYNFNKFIKNETN